MGTTRTESRVSSSWSPGGNLRALKWLAIVMPLLLLVLVDILRQAVFSSQAYAFPGLAGLLVTYAVLLGSVVAFSYTIFAFIGRLQGRLIDQKR